MNSFMDTIKFALVIALPDDETFGYLIIASFAFIIFGFVSYLSHALNSSKRKVHTVQCISWWQWSNRYSIYSFFPINMLNISSLIYSKQNWSFKYFTMRYELCEYAWNKAIFLIKLCFTWNPTFDFYFIRTRYVLKSWKSTLLLNSF